MKVDLITMAIVALASFTGLCTGLWLIYKVRKWKRKYLEDLKRREEAGDGPRIWKREEREKARRDDT